MHTCASLSALFHVPTACYLLLPAPTWRISVVLPRARRSCNSGRPQTRAGSSERAGHKGATAGHRLACGAVRSQADAAAQSDHAVSSRWRERSQVTVVVGAESHAVVCEGAAAETLCGASIDQIDQWWCNQHVLFKVSAVEQAPEVKTSGIGHRAAASIRSTAVGLTADMLCSNLITGCRSRMLVLSVNNVRD